MLLIMKLKNNIEKIDQHLKIQQENGQRNMRCEVLFYKRKNLKQK